MQLLKLGGLGLRQAGALWPAGRGLIALPSLSLALRMPGCSVQAGEGVRGGHFHSCIPLDTTAAPSGWVGVAGSNPEHVLHRHIPADVLETTALPTASSLRAAVGWHSGNLLRVTE